MSVYGMSLRLKIVSALNKGETVASVTRRFDVDQKTVRSYRRRHAAGRLEPDHGGVRGHTKLTDDDLQLMCEQVAAHPDITLAELRDQLSVPVALSTVHRALKSMGLSFKKSR